MNNLNKRRRSLLLFAAPFCTLLLASYLLRTAVGETARRSTSLTRSQSSPARAVSKARTPRAVSKARTPRAANDSEAYQIISQRNLFRPLFAPKRTRTQRSMERYVPPTPGRIAPLPPLVPVPIPRTQPTPSPQPPASPTDGIAVVGTVNVNSAMHSVIEDTRSGETRFIRVGEEAFGFRLVSIDEERATLERGGKTFTLRLGANKQDKPVRSPAGSQRVDSPLATTEALLIDRSNSLIIQQSPSQGGTQDAQQK